MKVHDQKEGQFLKNVFVHSEVLQYSLHAGLCLISGNQQQALYLYTPAIHFSRKNHNARFPVSH